MKTQMYFRWLFLVTTFTWLGVLQGVMLWYLEKSHSSICNALGAWPFSSVSVLSNGVLTLCITLLLVPWAWKNIQESVLTPKLTLRIVCWTLVIGTGLSHALERLAGGCIIDYWTLNFFAKTIVINLGDIALTLGSLGLIMQWYWEQKKSI